MVIMCGNYVCFSIDFLQLFLFFLWMRTPKLGKCSMTKDGSSRCLSWNSAPLDSELQGPTFTHNAQGPSWPFCTPLPQVTHRPQRRISLNIEKHRGGKGAECLWNAWQKRSNIHETLLSPLIQEGVLEQFP